MFQKWLDEFFSPHVLNLKLDKIALIVDKVTSNGKVTKPDRLNIIALPANVTSIHQLMDMGTIRQWKMGYQKRLLRCILSYVSTIQKRRKENDGRRSELNGLLEGYDPNMWDVCALSKVSWDEVDQKSIGKCWIKASCLPHLYETDLTNVYCSANNTNESVEITNMTTLLQEISLETKSNSRSKSLKEKISWTSLFNV